MKTIAYGIVLAVVLGLSATVGVVPATAQSPQGIYQKQVQQATNQQRVKHDRLRFRKQKCVQRFAIKQARKMARQERMFHQNLGPILQRCGLRAVGENVAYGYSSGRAVVDDGWMHSEGHRANILNPEFRLLGAGARQSRSGTWYAAQVFGRKA